MIPKELSERIEALLTRKNTGGLQWPDHCTAAINVGDLRALLTAAQGQEWRPIAEAPRDGRVVDLWAAGARWIDCHYLPEPETTPGWYRAEDNSLIVAEADTEDMEDAFWRAPPPRASSGRRGELSDEPSQAQEPRRIQRSRARGWRMPPNTVYVGRPSRWGNPFVAVNATGWQWDVLRRHPGPWFYEGGLRERKAMELAVSQYRALAEHLPLQELRGRNLACWCSPFHPCHADVLLELANKP